MRLECLNVASITISPATEFTSGANTTVGYSWVSRVLTITEANGQQIDIHLASAEGADGVIRALHLGIPEVSA